MIFLLATLIFIGAMFVALVEQAPLWERVQVLGVGVGMYIGVLAKCFFA